MILSQQSLEREKKRLIRSLPLREQIFLPTGRIPLRDAVDGLRKVVAMYEWRLDAVHRPRLKALRGQFVGSARCFVIGNGPSLNRMDLNLLRNDVTFGVNGFFRKAAELAWTPTFHVVEDHLVAEDRAGEINAIAGSIKVFPANLAYCLDEDDATIFIDHQPRPSYPDGFDFSIDADRRTYTGCTVTFTCLQLAVYLGFREIYLIGVDADYTIPADASRTVDYGVPVIDMPSDDPNHFDPDYFGKGYRWHDPQVGNMLAAYQQAKRATDRIGVAIRNAGVGGKLEVFPRVEFTTLFGGGSRRVRPNPGAGPRRPIPDEALGHVRSPTGPRRPRLAVFDVTRSGDGTATGELKASLFADWDQSRLLHVYGAGRQSISVENDRERRRFERAGSGLADSVAAIARFDPECILYRPVPDNAFLHACAMRYLRTHPIPLVVWIMDDWAGFLRCEQDPGIDALEHDLRWLFKRAERRLAIGEMMADAFRDRYGFSFEPLANGIDPMEWRTPRDRLDGRLVVRYAGSLATNMVFDSVVRVARAIERLARDGWPICFEVNTRPLWAEQFLSAVSGMESCSVTVAGLAGSEYREFLAGGDVLLIAYNFDERSKSYVRYSIANKLPECLVAGAVLVHAPLDIATTRIMASRLPESIVSEPEEEPIRQWLLARLQNRESLVELSRHCRQLAESEFPLSRRRRLLDEVIRFSADSDRCRTIRYHERYERASLDEMALAADLAETMSGSATPAGRLMVSSDPARVRSSTHLADKGWRIGELGMEAPAAGAVDRIDILHLVGDGMGPTLLRDMTRPDTGASVVLFESHDEAEWRKAARDLAEAGYSVYLSEWYQAGSGEGRPCWRSLSRWPFDAWNSEVPCNLLAVGRQLGSHEMATALVRRTTWRWPREPRRNARQTYVAMAQWIEARSMLLFRVGRSAVRLLRWLGYSIKKLWIRTRRGVAEATNR